MKKSILILLLFQSFVAAAQIRIADFKLSYTDGAGADFRTSIQDPDGRLCAVLKLETKQSGWTFDTGLAGIIDTRYEDGIIWLYVPAYARKITVAHKDYGVLREWNFPVSLEPGRTYTMKLTNERPHSTYSAPRTTTPSTPASTPKSRPKSAYQPTPQRETTTIPTRSYASSETEWSNIFSPNRVKKEFCNHFIDFYTGFGCSKDYGENYVATGEICCGFSYTWIGNKVGPYLSLGIDNDECGSILGGIAYRITDSNTTNIDWQLYGGAGLVYGAFGFELGTRLAWGSLYSLSHWDLGFGCQFSQGMIIPTVSVGLYIWGIPAIIGVAIVTCAIGGMLY